jgi:small conductance mechanosensitive channel
MDEMFRKFLAVAQSLIAIYGLRLIGAIVILVVGRWVAQAIKGLIGRVCTNRKLDPTVSAFAANLAYVALLAFVIIAALGQLGVQTSSFIAVIGAAGLAVGLALQGSLSNFAAGFLIIVFRPFKKGDYIAGAGVEGAVEEIQVFNTVLLTADHKQIFVPNSKLMADNITNFTAQEKRRVDVPLAIGFGENLDRVRSLLLGLAARDARILKDPAPAFFVGKLADGAINVELRVWCKTVEYGAVTSDTVEQVKKAFQAENVALPQRTLRLLDNK